jgi:hypothetical protein
VPCCGVVAPGHGRVAAQKLPTAKAIPLGGGTVQTVPPPKTKAPKPKPKPRSTKPSSSVDPVRHLQGRQAAGYGPYYSGKDPEYDWYRDADSDGMVCKSQRQSLLALASYRSLRRQPGQRPEPT